LHASATVKYQQWCASHGIASPNCVPSNQAPNP
jgi:hypothetical protein